MSSSASQADCKKNDSKQELNFIIDCLEDAKAEDIITIDLTGKSSIGDYMVVASGRSERHVGAIADQLNRKLKDHGLNRARVEGKTNCDWILIDAGSVIVHVFRPEVREFYNIEKMWLAERPDMIDGDPNHAGSDEDVNANIQKIS